MRLLALDLSLRATGWADNLSSGVFKESKYRGLPRLIEIRYQVLEMAKLVDVVLLEGISFGSNASMHAEICGMHYAVQITLHEARIPTVLFPPATLKKFATGKGNAKKEQILAEAIRRLDYQGADHNEADALWLRQAGLNHYRLPGRIELPQDQQNALCQLLWPNPRVAV